MSTSTEISSRTARYKRLADYEQWAFDRVATSLESVGPGAGSDPAFVKACAISMHIELTRAEWLSRLTAQRDSGPLIDSPDSIFVKETDLRAVRDAHTRANAAWATYIGSLDAAELERVATYHSTSGESYSTPVEDILSHVSNHGSYHRGQIATLVRVAGGTPAVSDYIFFSRAH